MPIFSPIYIKIGEKGSAKPLELKFAYAGWLHSCTLQRLRMGLGFLLVSQKFRWTKRPSLFLLHPYFVYCIPKTDRRVRKSENNFFKDLNNGNNQFENKIFQKVSGTFLRESDDISSHSCFISCKHLIPQQKKFAMTETVAFTLATSAKRKFLT